MLLMKVHSKCVSKTYNKLIMSLLDRYTLINVLCRLVPPKLFILKNACRCCFLKHSKATNAHNFLILKAEHLVHLSLAYVSSHVFDSQRWRIYSQCSGRAHVRSRKLVTRQDMALAVDKCLRILLVMAWLGRLLRVIEALRDKIWVRLT